jgi:hypothetical protein
MIAAVNNDKGMGEQQQWNRETGDGGIIKKVWIKR